MVVLKIGHRLPRVSSQCRQISYSNVEGMEMEEKKVSGDDSDDCELTEVRCELGMVEGQLCNIPYELYDLPDLREILSLDTWNSCLTEEERFSLSAYLPDMDQQTFWLTMEELLDGNDVFFGNPLDIFFKRLKEGFYPPKVTCFREGLQFLQRRKYYHSLRSYHENMAQMFIDMRRVWDQCEMGNGIEERVYIWTTKKNYKGADLLDPNTFPKDGNFLSKEANLDTIMCHLSKKTEYLESKRESNLLPPLVANGMKFVSPNSSGKGVLKIKTSGNCSFQKHNPKSVLNDTLEQCRSAPKGVLKIVPKVPSIRLEQSREASRRMQTLLVNTQGLQDSRLSSLPASVYQWDAGFCESHFLRQNVHGSEVHRTQEQPHCILSRQEAEFLNCTTRLSRHSESSIRKIKRERNPSLDAIADLREPKLFGGSAGIWKGCGRGPKREYESSMDSTDPRRYARGSENLGAENNELSMRSLELYPFGIQYCEGERHMEPTQEHIKKYSRIPELASRNPDIGNGEQESFMASSDRMKGQGDASLGGEKLYSQSRVSDGLQDDLVLPITYKRRKAQARLNSLPSGKQLKVGADLKSVTPKESNHHLGESAKVVKIKLKGWKDQSLNKEA